MAQDVTWKSYFWDDERYADIINGIGCGGKQLITKDDCRNLIPRLGSFANHNLFVKLG